MITVVAPYLPQNNTVIPARASLGPAATTPWLGHAVLVLFLVSAMSSILGDFSLAKLD